MFEDIGDQLLPEEFASSIKDLIGNVSLVNIIIGLILEPHLFKGFMIASSESNQSLVDVLWDVDKQLGPALSELPLVYVEVGHNC